MKSKSKNTETIPISPATPPAPTPSEPPPNVALPDDRTPEFRRLIPLMTDNTLAIIFANAASTEDPSPRQQWDAGRRATPGKS